MGNLFIPNPKDLKKRGASHVRRARWCRRVAAAGRGCIAGSQRSVGEDEEHSSSGGMFYV